MPETNGPRYDDARQRFEELDLEEQASFLVEATATTVARGVLQAGKMLAQGLEDALRQEPSQPSASDRPGAAEPETSQRRSPQSGPARS